ncbi:hypothetical protein ACWDUN_10365 [Mycobacterium sp. NPDC003323]
MFTAGAILTSDPAGTRALQLHAQSQSAPAVVRRAAGASDPSRRRYADPRHRMLPKP